MPTKRKKVISKKTPRLSTKHATLSFKPILFTLAVLGLLYFGYRTLFPPQPVDVNQVTNQAGTVTLALTPANSTQASNTTRELALTISAGNKHVSGAQIEIAYDATRCVAPTVTQGTFLTGTPLAPVAVGNGKITFTYAAPPASGGATGEGTLATITTGPKNSSCRLIFTQNTIVTTTDNLTGNSLALASDASISLPGSSPSSTPNPSPSRTPFCPSSISPKKCQAWQENWEFLNKINSCMKVNNFQFCRAHVDCLRTHSLEYCLDH